jgi:hypothetical protein
MVDETRLADATAASKKYVEDRRSDLALDVAGTVAPDDVREGAILYAALVYQARSSPTGYPAYGDGAIDLSGDQSMAYQRAMRLIGWRRPVAL